MRMHWVSKSSTAPGSGGNVSRILRHQLQLCAKASCAFGTRRNAVAPQEEAVSRSPRPKAGAVPRADENMEKSSAEKLPRPESTTGSPEGLPVLLGPLRGTAASVRPLRRSSPGAPGQQFRAQILGTLRTLRRRAEVSQLDEGSGTGAQPLAAERLNPHEDPVL